LIPVFTEMNIYEFMSDSPWLTVFLAWGVLCVVGVASTLVFRIWNRSMRVITMWKNGYPPEHCDADGDFKEVDADEN